MSNVENSTYTILFISELSILFSSLVSLRKLYGSAITVITCFPGDFGIHVKLTVTNPPSGGIIPVLFGLAVTISGDTTPSILRSTEVDTGEPPLLDTITVIFTGCI